MRKVIEMIKVMKLMKWGWARWMLQRLEADEGSRLGRKDENPDLKICLVTGR
jgi:hypothetical protein